MNKYNGKVNLSFFLKGILFLKTLGTNQLDWFHLQQRMILLWTMCSMPFQTNSTLELLITDIIFAHRMRVGSLTHSSQTLQTLNSNLLYSDNHSNFPLDFWIRFYSIKRVQFFHHQLFWTQILKAYTENT